MNLSAIWFLGPAALLLAIYIITLQTIPNGSSHYYMIDVGETQIVLNTWGTLHATGYPHFVILGNLMTAVLRLFGVSPIVAPALVSLFWGFVTLGLLFALVQHLTGRAWLGGLAVLVYGLIRTAWVHFVIAEIYSFGTAIIMGLLCLALWRGEIRGRILWLALLGGVGVAHHRATVMLIPALLYAVWPQFIARRGQLPRLLINSLLLGLLGFVPYAYLMLRARAGADWVYGDPSTLDGLIHEFLGREASRFIGPANSFDALLDNLQVVNEVLVRDLTLPGLLLGLLGLLLATRSTAYRHAGITLTSAGIASYLFHVALYSDVLSALILQVILALVFGWVLLAAILWERQWPQTGFRALIPLLFGVLAAFLFARNLDFIEEVTTDPTGLETIEQAREAPAGSALMLAWGPRHFAIGVAQELQDDLQHIELIDHNADMRAIAAERPLLTPEYTLFNQSLAWWQDRLGSPVYLQAAAPHIVALNTEPTLSEDLPVGISVASAGISCTEDRVLLDLIWQSSDQPGEDLSVFVHGLSGDNPAPIVQADSFAPVYGWRPLTSWLPGEQIRDIYVLNIAPEMLDRVRYGLYRSRSDGFENVLEFEIAVICDEADAP